MCSLETFAFAKSVCFKTTFSSYSTAGHSYVDNADDILVSVEKYKKPQVLTAKMYATLSAVRYDDSLDSSDNIRMMQDAFTAEFKKIFSISPSNAKNWIGKSKRHFIQMVGMIGKYGNSCSRTYWSAADKVFIFFESKRF